MIPPVEERQVRPCEDCVFYKGTVIMEGWDRPKPKCNLGRFMIRNGGSCGRKIGGIGILQPCDSNFTAHEMRELIDSGVIE